VYMGSCVLSMCFHSHIRLAGKSTEDDGAVKVALLLASFTRKQWQLSWNSEQVACYWANSRRHPDAASPC